MTSNFDALITIVLPVHNGDCYLRESIDSVRSQTFADWELIILDDDSSDDSAAIAASYNDSRIRYSKNPERMGLFKTLNRGIRDSTSPLIRIWAHDDRMHPTCLARMAEVAEAEPSAGMLYCRFHLIDAIGNKTNNEKKYTEQYIRTPLLAEPIISALLFYAFGCLPGNISTVMLRRKAWEAVGGFWEHKQQAPDYDMWVRISEAWNVAFIDEPLVELRDHEQQLGRLGQKTMATIEEELRIYRSLTQRLSKFVSTSELNRFWRGGRGRQHFHWTIRAIFRGDISLARRGWSAIGRYGGAFSQAVKWLSSCNGRVGCISNEEFFDSHIARIRSSVQLHNASVSARAARFNEPVSAATEKSSPESK